MFRYFWLEGEDLPAGIGFGHFTPLHFLQLFFCFLLCLVLCVTFRRCSFRG